MSAPVPIGIGVRGLRLGLDNICVSQEQVEMEKEKRKQLLEDNRRLQQKRDEMYQLYLHKKQEQALSSSRQELTSRACNDGLSLTLNAHTFD